MTSPVKWVGHHGAFSVWMVETAGVEPASWVNFLQASTCLVRNLILVHGIGGGRTPPQKQHSVSSCSQARVHDPWTSLMRSPLSYIRRQGKDVAGSSRDSEFVVRSYFFDRWLRRPTIILRMRPTICLDSRNHFVPNNQFRCEPKRRVII